MIKYTTILHDKRQALGISMLEYTLLDTIDKLSKPVFHGNRENLANFIGMSRQGLIKAINRLEEKGLLKRVSRKELEVTDYWIDTVNKVYTNVNKVYTESKQSLHPSNNIDFKNKNYNKENAHEAFEKFRKAYPGTKRGFDTEYQNFIKKHKDWQKIIGDLYELLVCQINQRVAASKSGVFVPQWPHLQTYINQRRWEEEFSSTSDPGYVPQEEQVYEL